MVLFSPLLSSRRRWPALLALALPLASHAQSTPAGPAPGPAAPHLFVGLGAGLLQYQLPGGYTVNLHTRVPALVPTVGVAFGPRWSLQLSAVYAAHRDAGQYDRITFLATGGATTQNTTVTTGQRTWAVPVLVRYALRPPTRRFQLDVLGGVGLVSYAFRRQQTTDSAGVRVTDTDRTTRHVGVHVSLGLGLRYALTPQLSLTGDALVTRIVNSPAPQGNAIAPSLVLGLRYDLGRRK